MTQLERRPMGRIRINDEGYVEFDPARAHEAPKPSRRWEESPDGRRVARMSREWNMARNRRKLERVKAGLPANPPPPKPLSREQRIAQHRQSIATLRAALPEVRGRTARRVMLSDLDGHLECLRALLDGKEPRARRRGVEQQTSR